MTNLLVALGMAFIVSFFLIFLIARHDREHKRRFASRPGLTAVNAVPADFRLFTKFCTDLCEYLKLEISEISRPADDEIVIRAANANPITRVEYLLVAFHTAPGAEIPVTKVMEISDQIVSERISKGILVSPGHFAESVKGLPEVAPMEFIDGARMAELRKKIIL
jgi:hypothetical protein